MNDLTAIILTKNEELNIERCIKSINKRIKKIIVLDSYSNDRTIEIAKKLGAKVYQHKFENYALQFNYALDNLKIDTKWVFRLDADEVVPESLLNEIEKKIKVHSNDDINGFLMKYKLIFMGKFLKHGGCYPFVKMTVFKKDYGRFEERDFGEHVVLNEGKYDTFKNDCLHYDFKDINSFIEKHNWYATREVNDFFDRKNIKQKDLYSQANITKKLRDNFYYKMPLFLRAKLFYIYKYYIKLGFLDGKEGKIYAFIQTYFYRFAVDAKIYERNLNFKEKKGDKEVK